MGVCETAEAVMPLHVTLVIAGGVEVAEDNDGQLSARYVGDDVIVGQLGIAVSDGALEKIFPLSAGKSTAWDWVGLDGMTFRRVFGSLATVTVESPPTTFGDRLLRAMLTSRMTLDALAAESGVGRSTINRFLHCSENRPENVKLDTIIALAKAVGADGWWLLTGEGEPPHGDSAGEDHEG